MEGLPAPWTDGSTPRKVAACDPQIVKVKSQYTDLRGDTGNFRPMLQNTNGLRKGGIKMKRLISSAFFVALALTFTCFRALAQDQTAAAKPAAKAAKTMKHAASKAESLSGTMTMYDEKAKLIVVSGSNNVPFNFKVTPHTRIMVGGKRAKMSGLADQVNKQVTVKFRDMKKAGDIAESVEVTG